MINQPFTVGICFGRRIPLRLKPHRFSMGLYWQALAKHLPTSRYFSWRDTRIWGWYDCLWNCSNLNRTSTHGAYNVWRNDFRWTVKPHGCPWDFGVGQVFKRHPSAHKKHARGQLDFSGTVNPIAVYERGVIRAGNHEAPTSVLLVCMFQRQISLELPTRHPPVVKICVERQDRCLWNCSKTPI